MGICISILVFLWEWMDEIKVVVWGGNIWFSVDLGFFYVLKVFVFIFLCNCILNVEV